MKSKIIVIAAIGFAALTLASCTKCVTCSAYQSSGFNKGLAAGNQAVKVCDKVDIDAYEHGNNFTDPTGSYQVYWVCK